MTQSGKKRFSVALLIETSNAYARGLLDGVVAWQREHELWSIYLPEQERGAAPPSWLRSWKGDGVIARIENDAIAKSVRRLRIPVVDVSAARMVTGIPWVETDDHAIARLAVDHLFERGFRNIAFCGEAPFNWSVWREEHVCALAQQAGVSCSIYRSRSRYEPQYSWNSEKRRLHGWLRRLPKPVGVVACYDIKGQQILDACRELEIAVPEQIAVIGVDNDTALCELCTPSLTSIAPDTRRTGYVAAGMLDRLMHGENVTGSATRICPLGVHERRSTDTVAVDDPDVREALQFIRQNATTDINVSDVVRQVGVSRRVLESRFRRIVGHTPHREIERVRIRRIRQLLVETTLSIESIAARTGYSCPDYLHVAFKRVTGQTLGEFRAHHS